MKALDLSDKRCKELDELEGTAITVVKKCLEGKMPYDKVVGVAMSSMGAVAKTRQTMTSREGIRFQVIRSISSKDDLRKYVIATQPEVKRLVGNA